MPVTLITGGANGIGLETAKQLVALGHTVFIGDRDTKQGLRAEATVGARFIPLDVTDDASVQRAITHVGSTEGRLDVLVNNAGIHGGGVIDGPTALKVFDTNAIGWVRVTEAALPLLRESSSPVVVTVSSSAGSFWAVTNPSRPEYGLFLPLYSASKSAITMLTVQYAKAYPGIKFNAVEPGTTATGMTASLRIEGRPAEESAKVVVRLATLGPEGPTATLQDDDGAIPW
ncbi:SDR family NAD(P)-dependent oxidoreductase [Actinoplanes sp. NPDC049265]|uniref:SDR family NAD(P)-dependent oxidoreductase n=1 Tax=Actinoplanes sp. NPDC049265 TaxID=3363902 RepID=UPI00371DE005